MKLPPHTYYGLIVLVTQGEVNGSPVVYYNPLEGAELEVGHYIFTANYTESREVSGHAYTKL